MNTIPITELDDPRLDPYRDLKHADVSRRGQNFIAEGHLVVSRLFASDYETSSVLAEPNRLAILKDVIDSQTPVYVVERDLIGQVAGFDFHRGVLASGRRKPLLTMEQLAQSCLPYATALSAISLTDAENVGSLIRTASALGIGDFVINRQSIDPLCRRVLRVSMGTALKMRFYDLSEPEVWFEQNGVTGDWQTIAMTLSDDSVPLELVPRDERPKMIVMGNEVDGLPPSIQRVCHIRANIPMAAGVDSLNVAVAGGIALYELTRPIRQ